VIGGEKASRAYARGNKISLIKNQLPTETTRFLDITHPATTVQPVWVKLSSSTPK